MLDLGMNAVRVAEIWPGWSVIEHAPGKYDYELLDDYVEKAVKNGLKVCMGVGINDTPFWLYSKYNDLRCLSWDSKKAVRRVQSACIDHNEYREHMGAFIEDITKHYSGVEGIFSWQLGNEIRYGVDICDCSSTRARFREWLRVKYKSDLKMLNNEWGVYYHDWNEIYPYKSFDGPPTEGIPTHYLNTLEFKNWSLEELLNWGTGIMKQHTALPIF
ncbi:MAG: beta-galactosidase, partial [Verrucomicrobia bacterium]|nr:beta-galactosidase [Prolixibacteraceae bacterium]